MALPALLKGMASAPLDPSSPTKAVVAIDPALVGRFGSTVTPNVTCPTPPAPATTLPEEVVQVVPGPLPSAQLHTVAPITCALKRVLSSTVSVITTLVAAMLPLLV